MGVRAGSGWEVSCDGSVVVARFEGILEEREGRDSAAAFRELAGELEAIDLVFDVGAMEGYATAARKAWQDALVPLKKRLRSFKTVGANPIVRMGASTLGLLAGVVVAHE